MRLLSFTLALFAAGCTATVPLSDPAPSTPSAPAVERYQATITPQELAGHLYVYADDYLAGRETGEPGQRFASRFLAGQYAAMGVAAKGTGTAQGPYAIDGYLQPFALEQSTLSRLTTRVFQDGVSVLESVLSSEALEDARLVPIFGRTETGGGPIVYVGDGSGLDALDLEGAYAVLSPGADQAETRAALSAIGDAGALAAVIVGPPVATALQAQAAGAFEAGGLSLPPDGDDESGGLPPILITSGDVVADLMAVAGLEAGDDGYPLGDTGLTLDLEAVYDVQTVMSENVVAIVEGSDPLLRDEVVVISAHLDHVGDDGDGEDMIYNGADDDGSGTVSILEIAEAFRMAVEAGEGPRRSVLFLHVSGEEKGLLGSEYYTDREPLMPIEDTVANLNIDMIGRYDPERGFDTTDYVYIIGGDLISQDLHDLNARVNDETGTDLFLSDRFNSPDDPNQFFRRSDHWNFGKYDVPFIFYFTGTHEDYHGVGDSADKIDYDRMARIARLVFGTAWELANQDERPAVSGVGFN
ncbi:M28 family peptidase [Rubrivirga sp.]|uniref:M28 family peptidase n=1 Tax=Rubrivirga sp. TaxID=1885344 RepID=UPI003C7582E7